MVVIVKRLSYTQDKFPHGHWLGGWAKASCSRGGIWGMLGGSASGPFPTSGFQDSGLKEIVLKDPRGHPGSLTSPES